MPFRIPNIGEINLTKDLIYAWGVSGVRIHLYKNNITPDEDTVVGDLTEADYSGYAYQDITSWTTPATDASGRAFTVSSTATFPLNGSGSQDIYGWYATDYTGNLKYVFRYAGAPIAYGGPTPLEVTIVFRDQDFEDL